MVNKYLFNCIHNRVYHAPLNSTGSRSDIALHFYSELPASSVGGDMGNPEVSRGFP
jgi:hypothetical protein